jgi:epoxyqueuosine reductase
MSEASDIHRLARDLGFDAAGIARVDADWAAAARLERFVALGHHGRMGWMEETLARRRHPRAMWPEARSAIAVAMNYGPDRDPLDALEARDRAAISVYAHGSDYHDILKKRLKRLARAFAEETGQQVKVFVDTAPLMEKPLAALAGLGWQGKHTNLVSRTLGSWTFLGIMLSDAELEPDAPEIDHCGSCRACLDICPTDAFPAPYQLDARRCISYLTIEHDGPIPLEFRRPMGNRIYGCDDCLAVCPWNKFAEIASESAFHARIELRQPELADLVHLDDGAFREVFSGSPIKRIGRGRFIRNVLIAIGNSGAPDLVEPVRARLGDDDPQVRGAAVWALRELSPAAWEFERELRQPQETHPDVQAEWTLS